MTENFHGRIEEKIVAQGSKSERAALVLRTDDGRELLLRIRGGNPFEIDVDLAAYKGQAAMVSGTVWNGTIFLNSAEDVKADPPSGGLPPPTLKPF